MDWFQWFGLLGSLSGLIWIIHTENQRRIEKLDQEIKAQAARTDRLYEMFVDLLKERRS